MKTLREDNRPADLWFWSDWLSSIDVRSCSLAAQGLWANMLAVMSRSDRKGFLSINGKPMESKELAKFVGEFKDKVEELLIELEYYNVFSRDTDGTIYNRRMVREAELSKKRAAAGRIGGSQARAKQNESKYISKSESKSQATLEDEYEYEYEDKDFIKGGSGGKPKFEARHLELARFLEMKVRENVPYHKFTGTNYIESWAREFRLMEERDKITFPDIKCVLERSLEDEFWRINILSAGTFREKFGRLAAKMKGTDSRAPDSPHVGASTKPDKDDAYWARVREFKARGLEGEALTKAIAEIEGRTK